MNNKKLNKQMATAAALNDALAGTSSFVGFVLSGACGALPLSGIRYGTRL